MVIEVVSWPGAAKKHVINQDFPRRTLCGLWIPSFATKEEESDEFVRGCLRCLEGVMKS